jgi:hypothetical protein
LALYSLWGADLVLAALVRDMPGKARHGQEDALSARVATDPGGAEVSPKRKPKGASPTARSLAEFRKRGWPACVVEKWIPQTRQRRDAFGFGDLLVLDGKPGALLVQATADNGGAVAARVHKICGECSEHARAWLAARNRIAVHGWGMRGAEGKAKRWRVREVEIVLVDGQLCALAAEAHAAA